MNGDGALEGFLKDQSIGLLDSKGSFTISTEKAMFKLAAFQLPRPEMWILKVVQAAVILDCSNIKVTVTRGKITIEFTHTVAVHSKSLLTALGTTETSHEPGISELVTGLRAVGVNPPRSFGVAVAGEIPTQYITWNGKDLAWTQAEHTANRRSLTIEVANFSENDDPSLLSRLYSLATKTSVAEHRELSKHVFGCPVPITVDGRRLDVPPLLSKKAYIQPLDLQFEERDLPEAMRIPEWAGGLHGLTIPPFRIRPYDSGRDSVFVKSNVEAAFFWTLTYHFAPHLSWMNPLAKPLGVHLYSEIYWIKDGVAVGRERIDVGKHATRLLIFASATGLMTDLSGFRLRDSDQLRERRERILEITRKRLRDFSQSFTVDERRLMDIVGTWRSLGLGILHLPLTGTFTADPQSKGAEVGKTLTESPRFRRQLRKAVCKDISAINNALSESR